MNYTWNIYEPADPADITDNPYDVFVYSQTMPDAPHRGDLVFVEGRNHRIIACQPDHNITDSLIHTDTVYYKVCIVAAQR